jgi:3-deoxy-manno-octulosonate cytidylyltransferase (CMP-KDO synthetase)
MASTPSAVAIIPARLASTRFPRKVLADRTGKPLIQHVWERARLASSASRVVIAADDAGVAGVARGFGAECVLTRADHANGTSRLAEAAAILGLAPGQVVVNVQGDEPELDPGTIDAAVEALGRTGAPMATCAAPFAPSDSPADPNIVKVVRRLDGTALYFSRSEIPFDRDGRGGPDAAVLRHVGLYAYTRGFLEAYAAMAPTPLERCEQLEQLRALEHGHAIAVAIVEEARAGIDTPAQYDAFVARYLGTKR